jgi:alpha-pyrone synthase
MSSFINSIGTAVPPHEILQSDVVNFMIKAHGLNDTEAHDLKVLYRATGIQKRHTTIPDYGRESDFEFYPENADLTPFPSTKKRVDHYRNQALKISAAAAHECLSGKCEPKEITHLITVSCTGMYAPGLDIDLVNALGLNPHIERTCINFMGCYAAFNALKVADHICNSGNAKVLVVCTELCTVHFQKEKNEDNLLANALFGDGSAAVLVESNAGERSIELSKFRCDLLPSAQGEMAWKIGDFGFEMKLSAYVPDAIRSSIQPLLGRLKKDLAVEEFDFFAIHPGGKRILKVVEEQLKIDKDRNKYGHEVLGDYGNMSSPTILFVLKRILDSLETSDHGKSLLAFAFGPGLTLESLAGKIHVK